VRQPTQRAQFSGFSSKTNAHSETGQTAVCCQNQTLGALSSRSAFSVLIGALFKKFGLFFEQSSYILLYMGMRYYKVMMYLKCEKK
jgi:hypothetical protein